MVALIELNTEEIRTTIEGMGYKYIASYPPKDYGEAIVVNPSTKTYSTWGNGDKFREIFKKLKEEFNESAVLVDCGTNIDMFYEKARI